MGRQTDAQGKEAQAVGAMLTSLRESVFRFPITTAGLTWDGGWEELCWEVGDAPGRWGENGPLFTWRVRGS